MFHDWISPKPGRHGGACFTEEAQARAGPGQQGGAPKPLVPSPFLQGHHPTDLRRPASRQAFFPFFPCSNPSASPCQIQQSTTPTICLPLLPTQYGSRARQNRLGLISGISSESRHHGPAKVSSWMAPFGFPSWEKWPLLVRARPVGQSLTPRQRGFWQYHDVPP